MEQDRLGVKPEFFERLVSCDWFCNCGDKNFDRFESIIEENQEHAIACMNSLVRENACLDAQNAMSFWASKEIPGRWNDIVGEIKRTGYIGKVSKRIKSGLKRIGIADEDTIVTVRSDVLFLFIANYFSEYYTDDFYERMLQIYLSGHMPCGYEWKKFRVY